MPTHSTTRDFSTPVCHCSVSSASSKCHRSMRSTTFAVLLFAAFLTCLAGCGPQVEYKLAMNTPWPDEYTPPKRSRAEIKALLSPPVVRWHRTIDPRTLESQARQAAAGRSAVYALARRTLAPRSGGGGGPSKIWIVEARLGRRFIPATAAPQMVTASGQLGDVAADLARRAGLTLTWSADSAAQQRTVSVSDSLSDPRASLARVLADAGLFIREWDFFPLTLRSCEYASESSFLRAVGIVADELQAGPQSSTITVVSFAEWQDRARRSQRELFSRLSQRLRGRRQIGEDSIAEALPSPTLLSSEESLARQQAAFAVAAQISPAFESPR